jgi:hypothetical protein
MDYGLIGGLAKGLQSGIQSYQAQKKDDEEQALKKRQMQLQEIGAYGKLKDELGEVPPELQKAFSPEVVQPMEGGNTGLLPKPSDSPSGLLPGSQPSSITPSPTPSATPYTTPSPSGLVSPQSSPGINDWQKTINPMSRRGREINKELAQLNAASIDKGRQWTYDLQKGGYTSIPAELSPIGKATQEHQNLENQKLKSELDTPKANQAQAAMFGKRMEDSHQIIENLANLGYNRTSNSESLKAAILPDAFQGENFKLQQQAERNFVNAVLRRESGAAISQNEFNNAEKQYFPRAGDTQPVLDQKAQNRLREIEGFKNEAGKAWAGMKSPGPSQMTAQNPGLLKNSKSSPKKSSGLINSAQAGGSDQIPVLTPEQLNGLSDQALQQYWKKVTGK